MKIAILLVLTAFLELASCDTVCMSLKISSCFAKAALRQSGTVICGANNMLIDCIKNAARECGMENAPIVEEVVSRYTELCKEGTKMNDLYERHKICVYRTASWENLVCMQSFIREVKYLPNETREQGEKVLRVTCKYVNNTNKCINDNINSTCGPEASEFRHHLSDPGNRLTNLACVEIGAETIEKEEDASRHHHDHSDHVIAQDLHAAGVQAGIIQMTTTVAPEFHVDMSAASINVSSRLVYILIATVFMKWFSDY